MRYGSDVGVCGARPRSAPLSQSSPVEGEEVKIRVGLQKGTTVHDEVKQAACMGAVG